MRMIKIVSVAVALMAIVGCSSTPVTVAPYAGYGGVDGDDMGNSWQVGVGFSFTLGGKGGYVTPVPGHPGLQPGPVRINNNVTSSSSATQVQNQNQGQTQGQTQNQTQNPPPPSESTPPFGNGGGTGPTQD